MLDWRILNEREREIVIGTDETAPAGICFMPVTDQKAVKNRVHLDLNPDPEHRDGEIDRIISLGRPPGGDRSNRRRVMDRAR